MPNEPMVRVTFIHAEGSNNFAQKPLYGLTNAPKRIPEETNCGFREDVMHRMLYFKLTHERIPISFFFQKEASTTRLIEWG